MMPAGLKRFLDHLFADLRTLLAIDNGKLQITKRHGAGTTEPYSKYLGKS